MKKYTVNAVIIFFIFSLIFSYSISVGAQDLSYIEKDYTVQLKTLSGRDGIVLKGLGRTNMMPISIPVNINSDSIDKISFYLDVSKYGESHFSKRGTVMLIYVYLITDDKDWYQFYASKNSSYFYHGGPDTVTITDRGNYPNNFKGDIILDVSAFYDVDVIKNKNIKRIYLEVVMTYGCDSEIFVGDIYGIKDKKFMLADFSTFDNLVIKNEVTTAPITEETVTNAVYETTYPGLSTTEFEIPQQTTELINQDTTVPTTTKFKGTGKNYITESASTKTVSQSDSETSSDGGGIFDENGEFAATKSGYSYQVTENENNTEPFLYAGIFTVLIGSAVYLMNKKSVKKSYKEDDIDE